MKKNLMRLPVAVLIFLCVFVFALLGDEVVEEKDDGLDEYRREREEYERALAEIKELVNKGELIAAERLVQKYEPKYAGKWSVGRFGFETRMQIGQGYLDQGNKKEALRLFRAAKPGGGCGNCMASQHVYRNIRVARIYDSYLNFPASFFTYLKALPSTILGGGLFRVLWGLTYSGTATALPIVLLCYLALRISRATKLRDGKMG